MLDITQGRFSAHVENREVMPQDIGVELKIGHLTTTLTYNDLRDLLGVLRAAVRSHRNMDYAGIWNS